MDYELRRQVECSRNNCRTDVTSSYLAANHLQFWSSCLMDRTTNTATSDQR